MPLDFAACAATIKQVLLDANTTTASQNLSASISTGQIDASNILASDPEVVAVRMDRLPALFVRLSDSTPDYVSVGPPGVTSDRVKAMATTHFDIIGLVRKDGGHQTFETLLTDLYNLARNVEGVFRQGYNLSGTALWCKPAKVQFLATFDDNGRWTRGFIWDLEVHYNYR